MLAINVSIPDLMIARLVQFWPWHGGNSTYEQQTRKLTNGLLNRDLIYKIS